LLSAYVNEGQKQTFIVFIWVSGELYLCTHKSVLQHVILPPLSGTKTAFQAAFFKLSQLQFLFKNINIEA
jgi:hypothetical protein